MMITVKCPECGEPTSVPSEALKLRIVCRCGADLDPSSLIDPSWINNAEPPSSLASRGTPLGSSPRKRRRPTPADVPERIGRYVISHPIGQGAFGTVYLANDENLERPVALKVAHRDVLRNPDLVERFKKEARVAAKMKHEGIVIVHDVGSWESWLYIATEFIDGRTLRDHLKEGPFAPDRAARIAAALAQALSHAHLAGVTHRDVKPTNVMITHEGKVKLIDFGLVQLEASSQTREHALLGTIKYMSPEQAAGDNPKVRYASDQYSLGVLLYQMLCGRTPYEGDDALAMILSPQPVPKPSTIKPGIPAELEAICLRALSKPIEARYDSCRAMAEALQKWLGAYDRATPAAIAAASPATMDAGITEQDSPAEIDLRSREPLHELARLSAERAGIEERDEFSRTTRLEASRKDAERRRVLAKQEFEAQKAVMLEAEARRQKLAEARIETEIAAAESEYQQRCESIKNQVDSNIAKADKECKWDVTMAMGTYEGKLATARKRAQKYAELARAKHDDLSDRLDALAQRHRISLREPTATPDNPPAATSLRRRLRTVDKQLAALESRGVPMLLRRGSRAGLDLLVFLLVAIPVVVIIAQKISVPAAAVAGAAIAAAVAWFFDRVALPSLVKAEREMFRDAVAPVQRSLAALDRQIADQADGSDENLKHWVDKIRNRCEEAVRKAEHERKLQVTGSRRWRSRKLELAADLFRARREELRREHGFDRSARGRLASLERRYRQERLSIDRAERAQNKAVENDALEARQRLREFWSNGLAEVDAAVALIRRSVDRLNPPWDAPDWSSWTPPAAIPTVVRFGEVRVALPLIAHGAPADPQLHEGLPNEFAWPALLNFPDRSNLLIEAPESARTQAVALLQAVAMRLLTSLPAGRVRLTIIDPVGLGGDFGAFFQLSDFEAVLPPVLTDVEKIDQCLIDHLGHIKKMISYLRNDHATIREYNELADEIAEPFRILVVADYPTAFSAEARDWLARIATTGPRCGVLTLVATTPHRTATPGFSSSPTSADVSANAVRLACRGRGIVWDDPDFAPFPLAVDAPPPPAVSTTLLRKVGSMAEDARKVMVPFEFVAPNPAQWWMASSASGIDVGIGKAGPTKAQTMSLGKGTSQHVLIAGRTGSGKSTLFHAMLVNLALRYSADEIEFYLIDFKKGVEFKTYATHELPHARVIAVESEREFGLSVLRRLDEVLRDRGERFRQMGVHDLKGYREIEGLPPLPRIVLAVDEFQEFFIEDDPLASDASQFLDRLVRQGRAFGVHVILGSQTLSGAYSLARSTLSQMGVRVALQCGEGDAHLILGEENPAARLLSRPGEAVYNDRNGLAEGNHFFQVVWLDESRREEYLRRIRELARERSWEPPSRQIVFEGNEVAALSRNAMIQSRFSANAWPDEPQRVAMAWLGEPVAIKEPTAMSFRRRAGDNVLILGQDAEAAAGTLAATVLSLAAQLPPDGPWSASFVVLDGVPEESPAAGMLARLQATIPHPFAIHGRAQTAEVLERLSTEVDRRLEPSYAAGENLYLIINNLGWFREIRRDEGLDFTPAGREAARPSTALSRLLRSGPSVGIHVLIWCDTLNNLNRALERNDQREFGTRVAFQMSANDSSHFLDTPQASRLGSRRALFATEETGVIEKFRPYGFPSAQWLNWVKEQLARRIDVDEADGEYEQETEHVLPAEKPPGSVVDRDDETEYEFQAASPSEFPGDRDDETEHELQAAISPESPGKCDAETEHELQAEKPPKADQTGPPEPEPA